MACIHFQYVSDLHLEARKQWPYIPVHSPCLLLAGDIGSPKKGSLEDFFRDVCGRFRKVVYTPGNHEYFGNSIVDTEEQLVKICSRYDNLVYLQNSAVTLTDLYDRPVRILGTTLWAPCPDHVNRLRDFRKIFLGQPAKRMAPASMRALHEDSVAFLARALSTDRDTDTIVLTHHGPMLETNGPFMDHPASLAYASDLRHLIHDHVKGWIYGHTHQNMTLQFNNCTVATNALGYPGEKVANFRPVSILNIV